MKIPLSKTMRMEDFQLLVPELLIVDRILAMLGGGDKAQHPLRRWEYAMALRAYMIWLGIDRTPETGGWGGMPVKVSDHGCCTGMLAPMMFWLGNEVWMYEVWSWGNQEEMALRQMEQVKSQAARGGGPYKMINRPLGQLTEEDGGVDVAFCISTMEHIPNFEHAFKQYCATVNPGGMLFMTTDSAQDENDHYIANNVRAGTMFNKGIYEKLAGWAREQGFELLGGESDWSWDNSCQLIPSPFVVGGYGFACLSMQKKSQAMVAS